MLLPPSLMPCISTSNSTRSTLSTSHHCGGVHRPMVQSDACRVNDSVVRLGVMQGEYHWHKHDQEDEFFYVVEGRFLIDLEGRTVELTPRQGLVVPKGVVHRTRAAQRAIVVMIEAAGIVPTGD